jgi:carnitine O-palmitoyltransferase 1
MNVFLCCILDEGPHSMSWSTTLWAVVVRLVSGYHPTTFSCQKSLPFLPVPSLDQTINKFVASIEPLYENPKENEDFKKIRTDAEVRFFFFLIFYGFLS